MNLEQTQDLGIHNHSLGKNPSLTEAVALLAESGEKILLHPHDFAEDGRPGNYLSLSEVYLGLTQQAHIHYAALNQRDRGFLAHMLKDCPSQSIYSPIQSLPAPLCKPLTGIPSIIFPKTSFFIPYGQCVAKISGNSLLASAHLDFHFANSLGPTNPAFVAIFEEWKQFGNELGLPLTYGLGQSNASFPEMVRHAQCIISVSVAEGFGLGFLEPWTFGKGLCGRNLPEITCDFAELGVSLQHLYNRMSIPLDCIQSIKTAKQTIQDVLEKFYQSYRQDFPAWC